MTSDCCLTLLFRTDSTMQDQGRLGIVNCILNGLDFPMHLYKSRLTGIDYYDS